MLIRAVTILLAAIALSMGLTYLLGAEVVAAFGLIVAQTKILLSKTLDLKPAIFAAWLKAQGLNFARVEVAKRWLMNSLFPLLVGASLRRRITAIIDPIKKQIAHQHARLKTGFTGLPLPVRVILIVSGIIALLGLTATTLGLWVLVFTIQVPLWLAALGTAAVQSLWQTLQKMAFRTLAFTQLFRAMRFMQRFIPRKTRDRLRRFEFRVARRVVRQRRLTIAQLRRQKLGRALRVAVITEYFRPCKIDSAEDDDAA